MICSPVSSGLVTKQFFIRWLAEAPWPLVFARGHALDAVFNQLVRSRTQLLVAEELFVPSEQAKKTGD